MPISVLKIITSVALLGTILMADDITSTTTIHPRFPLSGATSTTPKPDYNNEKSPSTTAAHVTTILVQNDGTTTVANNKVLSEANLEQSTPVSAEPSTSEGLNEVSETTPQTNYSSVPKSSNLCGRCDGSPDQLMTLCCKWENRCCNQILSFCDDCEGGDSYADLCCQNNGTCCEGMNGSSNE